MGNQPSHGHRRAKSVKTPSAASSEPDSSHPHALVLSSDGTCSVASASVLNESLDFRGMLKGPRMVLSSSCSVCSTAIVSSLHRCWNCDKEVCQPCAAKHGSGLASIHTGHLIGPDAIDELRPVRGSSVRGLLLPSFRQFSHRPFLSIPLSSLPANLRDFHFFPGHSSDHRWFPYWAVWYRVRSFASAMATSEAIQYKFDSINQRMAILAPNSLEWIVADFASVLLRLIVSPFSVDWSDSEFDRVLLDYNPQFFLVSSAFLTRVLDSIQRIRSQRPDCQLNLRSLIVVPEDGQYPAESAIPVEFYRSRLGSPEAAAAESGDDDDEDDEKTKDPTKEKYFIPADSTAFPKLEFPAVALPSDYSLPSGVSMLNFFQLEHAGFHALLSGSIDPATPKPRGPPENPNDLISIYYSFTSGQRLKGQLIPIKQWKIDLCGIYFHAGPWFEIAPQPFYSAHYSLFDIMVRGASLSILLQLDYPAIFEAVQNLKPTQLSCPPAFWRYVQSRFESFHEAAVSVAKAPKSEASPPTSLASPRSSSKLRFTLKKEKKAQDNSASPVSPAVKSDEELRQDSLKEFESLFGVHIFGVSAGSNCPSDVQSFLRSLFPSLPIPLVYSYPETGAVATDGLINNYVKVRVLDLPELGFSNSDQPNPRGELQVRTSNMGSGYSDPVLTKESFLSDGFFATGDIAELLPNNHIRIIGRCRGMYKLAHDLLVEPERIESLLLESPFIEQIYVHTGPDFDRVACVIVPNRVMVERSVLDSERASWREKSWSNKKLSTPTAAISPPISPSSANSADSDLKYDEIRPDELELSVPILSIDHRNWLVFMNYLESLIRNEITRIAAAKRLAPHEIPHHIILEWRPFNFDNRKMDSDGRLVREELANTYHKRLKLKCSSRDRAIMRLKRGISVVRATQAFMKSATPEREQLTRVTSDPEPQAESKNQFAIRLETPSPKLRASTGSRPSPPPLVIPSSNIADLKVEDLDLPEALIQARSEPSSPVRPPPAASRAKKMSISVQLNQNPLDRSEVLLALGSLTGQAVTFTQPFSVALGLSSGLDSFSAAKLASLFIDKQIRFSSARLIAAVQSNPAFTVDNFCEFIRSEGKIIGSAIIQPTAEVHWEREIKLPTLLQQKLEIAQAKFPSPASGLGEQLKTANSPAILLTGASSLFGSYLLASILRDSRLDSVRVVCLCKPRANRDDGAEAARQRLIATLKSERLDVSEALFSQRTEILIGDFTQPDFGLSGFSASSFIESRNLIAIFHAGSRVNHAQSYEELKATNCDSVVNLLNLAVAPVEFSSPRAPLAFYLFSTLGGYAVDGLPLTRPILQLTNGDSQSRWVAERLIEQAAKVAPAAPIAVFAVGNTLGRAAGHSFLTALITGSLSIGSFPPANAALISALQIGSAADCAVELALKIAKYEKYILSAADTLTFADLTAAAADTGIPITPLTHSQWLLAVDEIRSSPIARFRPVLEFGLPSLFDPMDAETHKAIEEAGKKLLNADLPFLTQLFKSLRESGQLIIPALSNQLLAVPTSNERSPTEKPNTQTGETESPQAVTTAPNTEATPTAESK